jgi:hypothetical protein
MIHFDMNTDTPAFKGRLELEVCRILRDMAGRIESEGLASATRIVMHDRDGVRVGLLQYREKPDA